MFKRVKAYLKADWHRFISRCRHVRTWLRQGYNRSYLIETATITLLLFLAWTAVVLSCQPRAQCPQPHAVAQESRP